MRISGLITALIIIVFNAQSQTIEFEWVEMFGNPPNTTDTRTTLSSMNDGSFFMAGEFLDTALFGTKTMVSAGGSDIFLTKCSQSGNVLWSVRIGGEDDEYVKDIAVDGDGNIIVSGFFYGTTMIGSDEYTTLGSQDLFIAKFDTEGDFVWSYRAGGMMADYISGITLDEDLNIILSGYFYNQINFGDTTLTAVAASDIFLAKFNSVGELIWVFSAGGSSSDQLNSITGDPDGNILIAGSYYYDFTIGDTTLTTLDPVGVFVVKIGSGGNLEQAFQINGTYLNSEIFITSASTGDFYLSGCFSEDATFGDKTFHAGEFNQDLYIARYSADCDLQWARHAFSYGSDQVVAIDTDESGNLYLTGHYLDTIHFELITLNYTLCCGSREIFIISYDADGRCLWGKQVSGTRANVKSLEMAPQGKLLLSGLFTEEMTLGPFSLSHYDGFRNYFTTLETGVYTSIADSPGIETIEIFPNPVEHMINISREGAPGKLSYMVIGMDGRLLFQGNARTGGTLDLSSVPSGLFILRLTDLTSGLTQNRILIKE